MEKRRLWSYENTLVLIFFLAIGFLFFDRMAINYLMPFMQDEFGINNTQIGLLASAMAITWGIAAPLLGFAADRSKNKKLLLILLVLGFSLISLLHGAVASFGMLLVLRLLMGVAEGPMIPITSSILAVESSEKRRGFNLGMTTGTTYALFGSMLAPPIVVGLAQAFNWRVSFFMTIIPGILVAILIALLVKNPKTDPNQILSPAVSQEKVSFKDVMRHRNVWLCLLIATSFWFFLLPFSIFAPLYMINVMQMTPQTMSMVMAAFGAGSVVWGVIVPAISDRIGRKPTAVFFLLLTFVVPLLLLYIDNVGLLALLLFVFISGNGAMGLMTAVIPSESVPAQYAATVMGIILAGTEIIGGVFAPVIAGAAADAVGPHAPMWISACAALLAGFFALFLKETAPVKVRASQNIGPAV